MKSTLSGLEPCLFLYFIRFLLIIDYLNLRMESCTNSPYLPKRWTRSTKFRGKWFKLMEL